MTSQQDQQDKTDNGEQEAGYRPSVTEVTQSVLAGAFGVQTNEARKRDFQSHSPMPYIIGGAIFTVLLVVGLIILVNVILGSADV
ncbi:MAG: DUF2970 domain-containing protein [Ectothiorhodospiraceae bacterium]